MGIDLDFEERVCVVTGGTRGIGRQATELFLREGARVVASGLHERSVDALRERLAGFDDRLHAVGCDMRDPDAGEVLVETAVSLYGQVDVVVNNAAAFDYPSGGPVAREEWTDLLDVKLLGYVQLMNAAHQELAKTHGAVVNVAGIAGVLPRPTSPHVGAVNAAIVNMSAAFAAAWAAEGIRVNVVSPGSVGTQRMDERVAAMAVRRGGAVEEARAELYATMPLGAPTDPAEVAALIAVLAAPTFRAVTGSHVIIDGGVTLRQRRSG